MASLDPRRNDSLAQLANQGDGAATSAYLAENLSLLSNIARRIAESRVQAEDLLSEAILGLLTKWASGIGPVDNPNAYVVRSMRNRQIDEFRSPRSRVGPLEAELVDDTQLEEFRRADLYREFRYLNAAVQALPPDYRLVLERIVVDGEKPKALAVDLKRPAPAVSSLLRRAKLALRRSLLKVMLSDRAPADCRRAILGLPAEPPLDIDAGQSFPEDSHFSSCPRCRAVWRQFASLASGLGASLAVVAGAMQSGQLEILTDERARTESRSRGLARVAMIGGAASLVAGLCLLVVSALWGGTVDAAWAAQSLTVQAQVGTSGEATVSVDLPPGMSRAEVRFEAPASMTIEVVPQGWTCELGAGVANCMVIEETKGTFVLADRGPGGGGKVFRVQLIGEAGDLTVTGTAQGPLDAQGASIRAFAELSAG